MAAAPPRRLRGDQEVATPETYSGLPPESRIKIREALLEHMDLIDAFADENPSRLDEAMAVLEAGLGRWFEEQGVKLD